MKNVVVVCGKEVGFKHYTPFNKKAEDDSYALFSKLGEEIDLKIFVTNLKECKKSRIKRAFVIEKGLWTVVRDIIPDGIYDKFPGNFDLKEELSKRYPIINHLDIERITKDKMLLYEKFPELVPKTIIARRKSDVFDSGLKSSNIVIKPRYGYEGMNVQIADIHFLDKRFGKDMIAQEFVDSSAGIKELGITGVHDLRIVFVDDVATISYVRQPKTGFISNAALGGSKIYIEIGKLPRELMKISKEVGKLFSHIKHKIYTVDFFYDQNQRPWIIELNSKPGIVKYPEGENVKIKLQKAILKCIRDSICDFSFQDQPSSHQQESEIFQSIL